jgi:hypothetical protein
MGWRGLTAAALVALVALTAAACGGGGHESPKEAYAKQLSSACTDMRKQIEALGKPSDTPIDKVYPASVRIGRAFVKQVRQLEPPPSEKANASQMARQFKFYFDGLAYGYAFLTKRNSQEGFIQTVEGALANLKLAEGYARKLGAPVCARRPFD